MPIVILFPGFFTAAQVAFITIGGAIAAGSVAYRNGQNSKKAHDEKTPQPKTEIFVCQF